MGFARRITAVAVALCFFVISFPALAAEMTIQDRLNQAEEYAEDGRVDEALMALDFAAALNPASLDIMLARIEILERAYRRPEARAFLDEALLLLPAEPVLLLKKAVYTFAKRDVDKVPALEDVLEAYQSILRARVASGGDAAFQSAYAEDHRDLILAVADALAIARQDGEALALYAIVTPSEGEDVQYQVLMARVNREPRTWNIHPTMNDSEFLNALKADGLSLHPINLSMTLDLDELLPEIERYDGLMGLYDEYAVIAGDLEDEDVRRVTVSGEQFYEMVNILSVSPDGTRFLFVQDGVMMIWDDLRGKLKLIAPAAGLDEEYVNYVMDAQFKQPEEPGIVWSEDGKYIALSFIRRVLLVAQFSSGTLLVDVEAGEARPVVPLPAQLRIMDMLDEDGGYAGTPIRAVFDPFDGCLYYEMYNRPDGSISRYNPQTSESTLLMEFDAMSVTADPSLWWTADGLMHTFASVNPSEGFGLAVRPIDREATLTEWVPGNAVDRNFFAEAKRGGNLISVAGRYAIYYGVGGRRLAMEAAAMASELGDLADEINPHLYEHVVIFSPGELNGDFFQQMTVIRPDAPAEERLDVLSMLENATLESIIELGRMMEASRSFSPYNAALSPDGRYALLAVREDYESEPMLFLYDTETEICGRIDISALNLDGELFATYASPLNNNHRGILWVDNNRILLDIDGVYKLFELSA